MLKFSSVAKFSIATGAALALGLGPTADQAFGIVHNLKSLKSAVKSTSPSELLVLRNWGLENNEFPSHINVRKAWRFTKGSKEVRVAVVDTGIDENHPDLAGSLCDKEKKGKEFGFDFVTNKKNPEDKHGHGSHVAGIIGATAKGNAGAAGVAPNICIIAVRYYSDTASGAKNLENTVKAINYAIDRGANIINYSGGGAEFSAAELKAIQRAESKGILFVAAAGNEYQDTDQSGNSYYPAAYGLSNIVAVAATNIRNQILPSSNWGKKHVHVAAPGENIYSTLPKGRYGYLTGTSQATAFVSGLAALIMSENPKLKDKPSEVRDIIMKSVDKLDNLQDKVVSGGRINAYAALRMTVARRDGNSSLQLAKFDAEDALELKNAKEEESKVVQRTVAFH